MSEDNIRLIRGAIPELDKLFINIPNIQLIESGNEKVLAIGSCFASHSTRILNELGFFAQYCRKTGFQYSPQAIQQILECISVEYDIESSLHYLGEDRLSSLIHHNLIGDSTNRDEFVQKIKLLNLGMHSNLKQADIVIITLGNATAQIHQHSGWTIAHGGGLTKSDYYIHSSNVEEIKSQLHKICFLIRALNPESKIIFTISPQRYGWLYETVLTSLTRSQESYNNHNSSLLHNNLDKAKLRVAVDTFLMETDMKNVSYFPSLEIVLDELRNYDGMNHDLNDHMHVSSSTPNYVMNRFLNLVSSDKVKNVLKTRSSLLQEDVSGMVGRLKNMSTKEKRRKISSLLDEICHFDFNSRLELSILNEIWDAATLALGDYMVELTRNYPKLSKIISGVKASHRFAKINDIPVGCSVGIYGAGETLDIFMKRTELTRKNIQIVVDQALLGTQIFSFEVKHPEEIANINCEYFVIASEKYYFEIRSALRKLAPTTIII